MNACVLILRLKGSSNGTLSLVFADLHCRVHLPLDSDSGESKDSFRRLWTSGEDDLRLLVAALCAAVHCRFHC